MQDASAHLEQNSHVSMVKYVLEQQAISFGINKQCDLVSDQLLLLSILCLVHVQLHNVFI